MHDSFNPSVAYRDVPGFPGYKVGSDGSVWSCWIRRLARLGDRWRRLKPSRCGKYGHLQIVLTYQGEKHTRTLGSLVLRAFVGPPPEGMECCHYPDRDPANCRLDNLMWGTRQDNVRHSIKDGTLYVATLRGAKNVNAKLTEADVRAIRAARGWGCVTRLVERYGVSRATIISIRMGRTWKHVL
jgi:hypothetical protein